MDAKQRELILKSLDSSYSKMFAEMQTEKHRKACDALFEASAEDLNNSFKGHDTASSSGSISTTGESS